VSARLLGHYSATVIVFDFFTCCALLQLGCQTTTGGFLCFYLTDLSEHDNHGLSQDPKLLQIAKAGWMQFLSPNQQRFEALVAHD